MAACAGARGLARYIFYRRYGLHDTWTTWLNAVLLFVVLFYVYPLKFVFTLLADQILGVNLSVTLVYCLIPILLTVHGFWCGGRSRQLAAQAGESGRDETAFE